MQSRATNVGTNGERPSDSCHRITVHMAEVDNEAETTEVLRFRPERLGTRFSGTVAQ